MPLPYSYRTYTGNGVLTSFAVPFPYVAREHVHVYLGFDPSTFTFASELVNGVDFTWATGTSITTTVPVVDGVTISVVRITPIEQQLSEWQAGSPPTAYELTTADRQILYAVQEYIDRTLQIRDDLDDAVFAGAGVTLIDNLASVLTTAALTANQGRVLKELHDAQALLVADAQADADAAVLAAAAAQEDADAAGLAAAAAQGDADTANTAASTAQTAADNAQTAADNAQTAADNAAPPSTVAFVARNTAPTGWLKANGALVSRTTYAALFAAIGTTFGVGDGSTTFGLPDLRGEFIRGWDDGRGVDSGRAFGSAQAAAFASHAHTMLPGFALNARTGVTGGGAPAVFADGGATDTAAAGGAETRPRNVALLAVIKF